MKKIYEEPEAEILIYSLNSGEISTSGLEGGGDEWEFEF